MNKQLLIEVNTIKVSHSQLTESVNKTNGNLLVEGILATAEVKNGNGRYYSKNLWEREMNKYNELVQQRRSMGELDHPESSVVNLKNVSHIINDWWWDGDSVMEVQDDFELLCWDFVSTPSNPGSYMHTLNEGKQILTYDYTKVNSIIHEILCSKGSCPIF